MIYLHMSFLWALNCLVLLRLSPNCVYIYMCIIKQTLTGSNIYIMDSTHLKQNVKASK